VTRSVPGQKLYRVTTPSGRGALVGADFMEVSASGALSFVVNDRIDASFAAGQWGTATVINPCMVTISVVGISWDDLK
jgi:hypothetical protein